jgi:hypothetical protein
MSGCLTNRPVAVAAADNSRMLLLQDHGFALLALLLTVFVHYWYGAFPSWPRTMTARPTQGSCLASALTCQPRLADCCCCRCCTRRYMSIGVSKARKR